MVSVELTHTFGRSNEGTYTTTLDAGSDPKGILVLVGTSSGNGRPTGPPTWDGTQLTALSSGFIGSGETGAVKGWFLGSGLTSGSASFSLPTASWTGDAAVYILNGSGDLEVVTEGTVENTTGTNHTTTLNLGGRTCFVAASGFSGAGPTATNALSGWTMDIESQSGSGSTLVTSYDTIAATNVSSGFTNNGDDGYVLAVAISEVQAAGNVTVNGTPQLQNLTASGASEISDDISGTPQLQSLTPSGDITAAHTVSGTPQLQPLTPSGDIEIVSPINGTPQFQNLTVTGSITVLDVVNGSPQLQGLSSSGAVEIVDTVNANPALLDFESNGSIQVGNDVTVNGSPQIQALSSSGTLEIVDTIAGTPQIQELSSSGDVQAADPITVSGNPQVQSLQSNGSIQTLTKTAQVTVANGINLSSLTWSVFDSYDLSVANLIKQGIGESTNASGLLDIDLSGVDVANGAPLSIVITDYTTSPTVSSNAAVCYTTASVS